LFLREPKKNGFSTGNGSEGIRRAMRDGIPFKTMNTPRFPIPSAGSNFIAEIR